MADRFYVRQNALPCLVATCGDRILSRWSCDPVGSEEWLRRLDACAASVTDANAVTSALEGAAEEMEEMLRNQYELFAAQNAERVRSQYRLVCFETEGVLKKPVNKTIAKYFKKDAVPFFRNLLIGGESSGAGFLRADAPALAICSNVGHQATIPTAAASARSSSATANKTVDGIGTELQGILECLAGEMGAADAEASGALQAAVKTYVSFLPLKPSGGNPGGNTFKAVAAAAAAHAGEPGFGPNDALAHPTLLLQAMRGAGIGAPAVDGRRVCLMIGANADDAAAARAAGFDYVHRAGLFQGLFADTVVGPGGEGKRSGVESFGDLRAAEEDAKRARGE